MLPLEKQKRCFLGVSCKECGDEVRSEEGERTVFVGESLTGRDGVSIERDRHNSRGIESGEKVRDETGIGEVCLNSFNLESCIRALSESERRGRKKNE